MTWTRSGPTSQTPPSLFLRPLHRPPSVATAVCSPQPPSSYRRRHPQEIAPPAQPPCLPPYPSPPPPRRRARSSTTRRRKSTPTRRAAGPCIARRARQAAPTSRPSSDGRRSALGPGRARTERRVAPRRESVSVVVPPFPCSNPPHLRAACSTIPRVVRTCHPKSEGQDALLPKSLRATRSWQQCA